MKSRLVWQVPVYFLLLSYKKVQKKRLQVVCLILFLIIFFLVLLLQNERRSYFQYIQDYELSHTVRETRSSEDPEDNRKYRNILSNQENIIFVGGVPRSGTTLMRAMLDAHPDIRCGEETMIIPMILQMRQGWRVAFFNESNTAQQAMDDATSAFLLEMIAKNGDLAKRLCNKDPLTAIHTQYLYQLFPNSRDGRAVVHSMIERDVPVGGFNRKDPKQMLTEWNRLIRRMYKQCTELPGACMMVYYERLVQQPEPEMRRILAFLEEPWNENVIKHEEQIGREIKLNPHEFSTDQVAEAVYEKALTSWFGSYQLDIVLHMDELAPMLRFLGYDTRTALPSYTIFASENFYQTNPFTDVLGIAGK